MKHIYFILSLFAITINVNGNPGNYYRNLDSSESCSNFKTTLFNLISNDTHLDYGIIDNNYYRTDSKISENGSGRLTLVERYCSENPTGLDYCFFNPDSICSGGSYFCQCFNKEHVVPKGWFNGSNAFSVKEYTDMHYLWPADSKVNGSKSNYPLGYATTPLALTSLNGTKIGKSDGTNNYGYTLSDVFEPIDSFKGDFARAYLYFVTRYQDSVASFRRNNIAVNVFSATSYTGLQPWILQLCIQWHKQDPPSDFEIRRNDAVFEIQGNRNPYIDYPHWVEKAFGPDGISACVGIPTGIRTQNNIMFSIYPNPTNNLINIQFGNNYSTNKNATIEIIDVVGQTILQQTILINKGVETLNVSNFSKGIYMVNIKNDGQNNVSTFVKE